jgi:zinc transport system substrate-binding protein
MKHALVILGVMLWATSCKNLSESSDKPLISVSILPQQYFLEQLAGDLVEVNVLVPPGASPATYEPTVLQLGKLDQSVLYMRIGYIGFEMSWMSKLTAVNSHMKVVDLSTGIDLILEDAGEEEEHHEHSHEGHSHYGTDPHIWMSAINARVIARNIHQELLLLFPEEKDQLKARLERFSNELDSLHLAISGRLDDLENRKFMIYHPALSYYARDYGLEQLSLEREGKSPSPSHLKEMTDLAVQNQISKILIQSQFDSDNAIVLARETGSEIIQFDPLSLKWSEQMYYIAEQLNPSTR